MQLCIFVSHIGGTAFGWLIPAAWGLSDSSEQFLFLSGFGLGSVFARKAARGGFAEAARDLWARARRLWRIHLLVLAGFGLVVPLADLAFPGEVARLGWARLLAEPWLALPAALGLHQPEFTGILPSFLFGMVLLPPFVLALERFGSAAILGPVGVYLAARAACWTTPAVAGEFAFDPLAWQVIFLGGAFLGRRLLLEGRAVGRSRALLAASLAVLLFGLLVRLQQRGFTSWPALDAEAVTGKERLAILRLLHAAALAYAVAALVPRDAAWLSGGLSRWLSALGRQSLTVFAAGLFLSYGATLILRAAGYSLALDAALVAAGALALGRRARRMERARGEWRAAHGFGAGPAYPSGTTRPRPERRKTEPAMPAASRLLALAGRNGPALLFFGVLVGLVAPALAEAAKPLKDIAVFCFTLGAFLKVDLAAFREEVASAPARRNLLVLLWVALGVPVAGAGLAASVAGSSPDLAQGILLASAAPAVASAPAIAAMLGLSAPFALFATLASTFAAPVLMPALLAALGGPHAAIDPFAMAERLAVIVGGAAVAAWALRRFAGGFVKANPHAMTGVAVVALLVFAVGAMAGMQALFLRDPGLVARDLLLAFAVNAALQGIGLGLFWGIGARGAATVGLVSGNRNVGLAWAAAGAGLPLGTEVFLAMSVLPIFMMPAVVAPLVARLLRPCRRAAGAQPRAAAR